MFPTLNNALLAGPNLYDSDLVYRPQFSSRDMLSIDIARGRDVGLQPYNQVRHFCGYPLAKDFDDLADLIHIKVEYIIKQFK